MLEPRPRERLLELVAFLYFVENKSQIKIGEDEEVRRLYHLGTLDPHLKLPPVVSQTTVNRLAHEARELGVAGVSVDWSFAVSLKEDKGLSAELADGFGLDECLVLFEDSAKDQDRPADSTAPRELADERRLILGLANVTAREVRAAWSAGDHIVCGGGQTICWFARAVRRNAPRKRDLTFSPLAGRLWVEDWRTDVDADIVERPLDADDAVHILSEAFEAQRGGRFSQINRPLYMALEPDAEKTLAEHSPLRSDGSWGWDLPPATWAYVGVGSLESMNHRLAKFLEQFERGNKAAEQSYLRVAGPTLAEIGRTCRRYRLPLPGDVANRLFPTLPLPGEVDQKGNHGKLREGMARVNDLVKKLNERAVVMTWEHLRQTRAVRVIAGGESKRRALWTVLLAAGLDSRGSRSRRATQSAPIVNQLTTDRETAQALLRALRVLKSNADLERLYHELCRSIGLSRSLSD